MFDFIYTETAVRDHPKTQGLLARFPKATPVPIERYGEVFNRKGQNFRLQKHRPGLVLAAKQGKRVLPTPPGYGIGSNDNFYFSHMLNCVYDCRYCFLQGMYRSAHMVLFVNDDDFVADIHRTAKQYPQPTFFTGYDCDSLALEGITGFVDSYLKCFADHPQALFELRTKSIRINPLLERQALANVVCAFSLTPSAVAARYDCGAPPIQRRLEAMARLQQQGWPLGLRFDPLIWHEGYQDQYRQLFLAVFAAIDPQKLHSVSLGQFRLPKATFKNINQLYPEEPLFARGLDQRQGMVSYRSDIAAEMHHFCSGELLKHIDQAIFFPCPSTTLEVH